MIESLLSEWDGETVMIHRDGPTGVWIIIALHSTRLGPAVGGTRMKSYASLKEALKDALRLASGMTFKFAVSGLSYGGGKAVIAVPAGFEAPARPGLLRRHGSLIRLLGGLFLTGPDVGISSADMDIIAETGDPYVFSRTPSAGGAGSPGPFTALGVLTGIEVACERLFRDSGIDGRSILVQGTGSVGGALIELLRSAGANVMFSEVDEGAIRHFRDEVGLRFVPSDSVCETECDIFAPCALGGILNDRTIPGLRCRAVVGGANNQLADADSAEKLRIAGVLYAPDYVINIGGAMAIMGMETQGWTKRRAETEVIGTVRTALKKVFELSEREGITTEAAARLIAEKRLSQGT
jgi:leucine dehydrogenase